MNENVIVENVPTNNTSTISIEEYERLKQQELQNYAAVAIVTAGATVALTNEKVQECIANVTCKAIEKISNML